jgi:hypothetical protein
MVLQKAVGECKLRTGEQAGLLRLSFCPDRILGILTSKGN